jgi:hypothetical protein
VNDITCQSLAFATEAPLVDGMPDVPDSVFCRACEEERLAEGADHGLCSGCEGLVMVELARLLESLGRLATIGTVAQVDDTRQSLSVLYVSTFLGTNADRIASFLGASRAQSRQYGMRFRAAQIWVDGKAKGPWSSKPWLSPAFCRLFLMDALVGAGLAVRGKDRWDFLHEGPAEKAA